LSNIETKNIRCGGGMPAFLATPGSAGKQKVPAIVLMHERYGLVKHTCDLAERFARDGFVCLAPDFFYKHPDQNALHRGDSGYALKDSEAIESLDSAVAELAVLPQVDAGKIAVKGVCQTGRQPLVFAAERKNIAAALVWYGAANAREWEANDRYIKPLDDMLAIIECPILGIFGEADHLISLDDVRRFRDSLDRHDKSYTIKIYAGAPHGWLNDTMPGRYRRDAAEAAWAVQLAFLRRVFDPGFDQTRRVQVYECAHAANYDFSKNVRME
jgi:carboxymethylenebutenolidase